MTDKREPQQTPERHETVNANPVAALRREELTYAHRSRRDTPAISENHRLLAEHVAAIETGTAPEPAGERLDIPTGTATNSRIARHRPHLPLPKHSTENRMRAHFTPDRAYRWTNLPCKASRRSLRRSAEGTQARIGIVIRPGQDPYPPRVQPVTTHLAERQSYRPADRQPHGPVVRCVPPGTPPPTCIHCEGPTELLAHSTHAVHIERTERRWICRKPDCLGRHDAVIYTTPLGEYERRC